MTLTLAGAADFFCCLVFFFVIRKLKRSQMRVLDSMFWLLFSLSFVIFGIFPEIALFISSELGFVSASNFVFLYVIAVLVVRDFSNCLRLSKQEERINGLASQLRLIAMILSIVLLITSVSFYIR